MTDDWKKVSFGKIINKSILDISDEEYFSDKYKDYISNSSLGIFKENPQAFLDGVYQKGFVAAFDFGSAVHELVLQPECFYLVENIDKPSGKIGAMVDYLVNNKLELSDNNVLKAAEFVDYYSNSMTKTKLANAISKMKEYYNAISSGQFNKDEKQPIFLSEYDRIRVKQCVSSLQKNDFFNNILYNSDYIGNELAVFLEIEAKVPVGEKMIDTTVKLKGKIDNLAISKDTLFLNDLKTTGTDIGMFVKKIRKFAYHRQIAFYSYLLKPFFEEQIKQIRANICAVETIAPFRSEVFTISDQAVYLGLAEMSTMLKKIMYYKNNEYDGITF